MLRLINHHLGLSLAALAKMDTLVFRSIIRPFRYERVTQNEPVANHLALLTSSSP
jgi:hypothetical protein